MIFCKSRRHGHHINRSIVASLLPNFLKLYASSFPLASGYSPIEIYRQLMIDLNYILLTMYNAARDNHGTSRTK